MKNTPRAVAWLGTALVMMSAGCGRSVTVGQLCDLTVDAGPSQGVVNLEAGTCKAGLCLKPVLAPESSVIDPPTGATCTDECSSDSDCGGQLRNPSNVEDTRCKSGFVCGVPFVVGPLCCKHYCLCKDFLGPSGAQMPVACQGLDALASCQSAAGSAAAAGIGQETDLYISVSPVRQLDMVFMIDDSPSMAPKVSKLAQQFPKLLAELKDPSDGRYPDLRVAIIDSDLGTGGAYPSGSCGPTASPDASKSFGDLGNFQMRGAVGCGANPDALWLDYYAHGKPASYNPTMDMSQVFGCLAGNLGALGCGQEHQLQSFEFALTAQNLHQSQSSGLQNGFLRPEAYLGLVILSDEDDCSAATYNEMFGDKPELRGESTSLRCATRAHQCNGVNLTDVPPGYPTSTKFEANFADCAARTDACPNATDGNAATDTSGPTTCSPLKDIHHLAQEIKALKVDPEDQIMVAGIFGWPRTDADMANAKYKIDFVPGPRPEDADNQQGQEWDYWPVCYDPDHEPADPAAFDADAWGWGAQGGLRISAFIDEFGANGRKFSICERDFTSAMRLFGDSIAMKLQNLCIDAKLMDVDPVTPGLQPDCRVVYRVLEVDSTTGKLTYTESSQSLPMCPAGATPDTITADCWQLVIDNTKCTVNGQLVSVGCHRGGRFELRPLLLACEEKAAVAKFSFNFRNGLLLLGIGARSDRAFRGPAIAWPIRLPCVAPSRSHHPRARRWRARSHLGRPPESGAASGLPPVVQRSSRKDREELAVAVAGFPQRASPFRHSRRSPPKRRVRSWSLKRQPRARRPEAVPCRPCSM
jgi:hypothetical protein